MPGGDRTGPIGEGPMTGRGLGVCSGYNDARGVYYGRGFGRRGFGRRGFGRGVGFRTGFTPVYGDEKEALIEQKEFLKQQLDNIEKRLKDLDIDNEA